MSRPVIRTLWLAVTFSILVLDLWTKHLAQLALPPLGGSYPLIDGFLSLNLVHNTGAAFGLFSRLDPTLTGRALTLVGIVAVAVVTVYAWRLPAERTRLQLGLALVLAGAVGNLVDRLTRGHVVDFIEVYWRNFHWPNFNVADTAISIGVGLLFLDSFLAHDPSATPAQND